MSPYQNIKKILNDHQLAPSKKFGQNFLVNKNSAEAIISRAGLKETDSVIEVGVGLGALTRPLSRVVQKVVGIEIDRGIMEYHRKNKILPSNVILIHEDILKCDFEELSLKYNEGTPLTIVANLPYSISNPFIFKLIENKNHVLRAVVMLQKEMAERLNGCIGTKEYGIPTILLDQCASVKKLMVLGPAEFHPRPKIDSMVIEILFGRKDDWCDTQEKEYLFTQVVRSSFSQRRKTILNTLSTIPILQSLPKDRRKKIIQETLFNAGIQSKQRAETLSPEDFLAISRHLYERHFTR